MVLSFGVERVVGLEVDEWRPRGNDLLLAIRQHEVGRPVLVVARAVLVPGKRSRPAPSLVEARRGLKMKARSLA